MSLDRPPLEEMTLRQLRRVASELEISRYSRMRKDQLLAAIVAKSPAPVSNPTVSDPGASDPAVTPPTVSKPLEVVITPSQDIPEQPQIVEAQEQVEAAKFNLGQDDKTLDPEVLASVDEGLPELPGGYGESRIALLPRDPQWAYAYWDVPNEHKEDLRRQGGQQLALRLCDVTDIDVNHQRPHSVQEYPCDELAREWYLPIPVSDRDYVAEVGYRAYDGRWLLLARSAPVRIPPVYPSDWVEDIFVTVPWERDLRGVTVAKLVPPSQKAAAPGMESTIYEQIFGMAAGVESQRVAGSLFGSMQQVPASIPASIQHLESLSSYVFPSGVGQWAVPTASGINMSGVGMYTESGAGWSASAAPPRPRKFWLVADAELIVYGATEPDATVTVGGRPIQLNPDGTFRFQMSFQDGVIDYPIVAVASDGEQTRSVHMTFERETPSRNTNTKDEAVLEWFS